MKPTILFVDDEQSVLDGLIRTMRQPLKQYKTHFLSSPEEALAFARAEKPTVVVSDIKMPGLNGLELVRQLHVDVPDTKAIMLTGTADLNAAMDAINSAGIFRFYTKPCDTALLAQGIQDAVSAWESVQKDAPNTISQDDQIGFTALNHLGLAVVIVDHKARILFTNSAGGTLFAETDGLHWSHDDVCRASSSEETKILHQMVKAAVARDVDTLGEGIMSISRPSMRRSLNLAITPLEGEELAKSAILFVSDPEKPQTPSPEVIAHLFDLTPAEARLTHALSQGARVEDAAETCGVTLSTARTYLKQIFQKTRTNRQAELIRLVMTAVTLR